MGEGGDGGRGWRRRVGRGVSVGARRGGYDARLGTVGRLPLWLSNASLGWNPVGHMSTGSTSLKLAASSGEVVWTWTL